MAIHNKPRKQGSSKQRDSAKPEDCEAAITGQSLTLSQPGRRGGGGDILCAHSAPPRTLAGFLVCVHIRIIIIIIIIIIINATPSQYQLQC